MKLLHKISQQYNTGPWLGGLKDLAARAMFYMGVLNFVQISAVFYYTTLRPTYSLSLPWMNFGLYFGILVLLSLGVMIAEYKFIIPSSYTFQNRQSYLHQNPLREDLKKILDKLEEIENRSKDEDRHNKPNRGS